MLVRFTNPAEHEMHIIDHLAYDCNFVKTVPDMTILLLGFKPANVEPLLGSMLTKAVIFWNCEVGSGDGLMYFEGLVVGCVDGIDVGFDVGCTVGSDDGCDDG